MLISFRQGIVSAASILSAPAFLQFNNGKVDVIGSPVPVLISFAHGTTDYLAAEQANITGAWGPFSGAGPHYLYWEIDQRDGILKRAHTSLFPHVATAAPISPQEGQMWFNTSKTTMYVWTAGVWKEVIRVLAGEVNGTNVTPRSLGSQVSNNSNVNVGYILRDATGKPIRVNGGTSGTFKFITTTTEFISSGNDGSVVKLENSSIYVRAGEPIPKFSLVYMGTDERIYLSNFDSVSDQKAPIGLVPEALSINSVGSLLTGGIVYNDQWSWSNDKIGKSVYSGLTGQITTVRPISPTVKRVGTIIGNRVIALAFDWETAFNGDLSAFQGPPGPAGDEGPQGEDGKGQIIYDNEIQRLADATLTIDDIGRIATQRDSNQLWILESIAPLSWALFTPPTPNELPEPFVPNSLLHIDRFNNLEWTSRLFGSEIIIRLNSTDSATWDSLNLILEDGEVAFDSTAKKLKVGDGSTPWLSLPYIHEVPPLVQSLTEHTDVSLSSPSSGQFLQFNGSQWVNQTLNIPVPVLDLNGLNDVTLSTPTLGNVLAFNGLQWVNQPIAFPPPLQNLTELVDVTINSPSSGQSLMFNGSEWVNQSPISTLAQLNDVTLTAVTSNHVLQYNGSKWVNQALIIPTPIDSLANLSDVALTSPLIGQALRYNGSEWINQDITFPPIVNALGDLSDIDIVSPTNGSTINFNGSSWVNTPSLLNTSNQFTKQQSVTPVVLFDAANIAIDASLSNNFHLVMNQTIVSRIVGFPTGLQPGQVVNLIVQQNGSGDQSITFDSRWKWSAEVAPIVAQIPFNITFISAYHYNGLLIATFISNYAGI